MGKHRWFILGILSFFGFIFAHGSWINRLLALILCGLLGADSGLCMATAAKYSGKTVAATPAMVEEILLAQRSREFDAPPVAPPPGNSQQAPPFPYDPGPNQPLRPDFRNGDPGSNSITNPLVVSQISPSTFDLKWVAANGCNFVTQIEKTNQAFYTRSVRFEPVDANLCGYQPFIGQLNPEGNKLEIKFTNSSSLGAEDASLVAELQDDQSLKVYYKENNSIIDVGTFSSSKQLKNQWHSLRNKQTNSETAVREAQCTFARRSCAGFATMGTAAGTLGLIAAATGVGAVTAAPALWSISAITSILGLGCFAMFGGFPPVLTANSPAPIEVAVDSYSTISGLSSLHDESEFSYRRGNRGIREPGNLDWDKPLADIRRKLGVDFCDKNIDDSGSQVAQRNESQERKTCQVPDEFWKTHKRVIASVRMQETTCIVPGAVMTDQGMVDGDEFCAVCRRTGNNTFGQPPDRALCSQPEDRARRNPVPNCPNNWAG